jgi:DNA-binding CsgD family transcriptional regulator
VLYDTFAQAESDTTRSAVLVRNPRARHVVVYTWNFHPDLIKGARATRRARAISPRLCRRVICRGSGSDPRGRDRHQTSRRSGAQCERTELARAYEGLTDRESEILALITQGKSNAEVAALTFLSPNTVKSYIRTIYRKIGVASVPRLSCWGVGHGFTPIITALSTGEAGP